MDRRRLLRRLRSAAPAAEWCLDRANQEAGTPAIVRAGAPTACSAGTGGWAAALTSKGGCTATTPAGGCRRSEPGPSLRAPRRDDRRRAATADRFDRRRGDRRLGGRTARAGAAPARSRVRRRRFACDRHRGGGAARCWSPARISIVRRAFDDFRWRLTATPIASVRAFHNGAALDPPPRRRVGRRALCPQGWRGAIEAA